MHIYELVFSDPWSFAGRRVRCSVQAAEQDGRRVLVRLAESVHVDGVEYPYAVLSARDGQRLLSVDHAREVSGVGLRSVEKQDEAGWGSEAWRGGGVAFLATFNACS